MNKKLILISILSLSACIVKAQTNNLANPNHLSIVGNPILGGSLCPAGLTKLIISQNKNRIRLNFNELILDVDDMDQSAFIRKNCSIRLPIKTDQNFQIGFRLNTVKGKINQSNGLQTLLNIQSSIVGGVSSSVKKTWINKNIENFTLKNKSDGNTISWLSCDRDSILASDLSMLIKKDMNSSLVNHVSRVDFVEYEIFSKPCP